MNQKKLFITLSIFLTLAAVAALATRKLGERAPAEAPALPAASDEYRRLTAFFAARDTALYIQGDIRLFESDSSAVIKETVPFVLLKNGASIYMQMGPLRTFCNQKYIVQLDTASHYIAVARRTDSATGMLQNAVMPPERLFSDTAMFKMTGKVAASGAERILTLQNDLVPEIKQCRMIYDTATYQLNRSEITWWQHPASLSEANSNKVWVTHTRFRYMPVIPLPAGMQQEQVVTIQDNTIIPAAPYKNYTLHTAL